MKILLFILTIVISFIIQIVDAKRNWSTCESQNGFCVAPLRCRLPGQRAICNRWHAIPIARSSIELDGLYCSK